MAWTTLEFWIEGYKWALPAFIYVLGLLATIDTIWNGRTSQGTLAWVTALTFIPFVALPLYLFFGSPRFRGYRKARKASNSVLKELHFEQRMCANTFISDEKTRSIIPLEAMSRLPQSEKNSVRLLINGKQTFSHIFKAIETAQHSILVQFYIVNDDALGRRLQKALIAKAKQGVKVYFLFDEIGSVGLRSQYITGMRKAGIQCSRFNPRKIKRRLQLNFRNHRKLVVIDGKLSFIGGHNVGDEYLGSTANVDLWRDTHLQIEGPATLAAQLSFVEDWYWAQRKVLNLDWQVHPSNENTKALVIPSGPADAIETMSLSFVQLILSAQKRVWIATPYFVPDLNVMGALQLAALKGLDVRILLPDKSDNIVISYATRNYVSQLRLLGISFLQYKPGFLHQKSMLIDDHLSYIGSANLDNRSLRINFELNALIECQNFAKDVEKMFVEDFHVSVTYPKESSLFSTLITKAARLFSPIL